MVNTQRPQGDHALQSSPPIPPLPADGEALKQQAGAAAQDLKDQVQETAGQATEQVKQTAQSLLATQKDRLTANLAALSDSLRQASEQLRGSESGALFASYLDTAATRVQGVSGHLDEHEVNDLFADLESYARQQPAVFLGGMFALGALAARFLRSTGQGTSGGNLSAQSQRPTVARASTPGPRTTYPQPTPQPRTPSPGTSATGQLPMPPSGTAATRQPTTPRPGTPPSPSVGSGGGSQPVSTPPRPPAPPAHGDRLESAHRGDVPSQPNPLVPPRLDPRPGQRDTTPPRPGQHDPRSPRQ